MAEESLKNPLVRVRAYFEGLRNYVSEIRVEVKRVTKPSWAEVYGTTLMVILTTFIFAMYFWVTDWAFYHAVDQVLKTFLKRT